MVLEFIGRAEFCAAVEDGYLAELFREDEGAVVGSSYCCPAVWR